MLVSRPGPLVEKVHRLGLEHVPLATGCRQLSVLSLRYLARLVQKRLIDVVHGYEWPPAMAFYLGPHLMQRVPAVCTVMSMGVAPFLPWNMPLIVGTEAIRRLAAEAGYSAVTLIEPPVDTVSNSPDIDGSAFRATFGLDPAKMLVVVVGRLSSELKLEGLLSACDAVGELAAKGIPVELAIVGDGSVRNKVLQRAERANALAGRRVVILTGSLDDPRPAYAAADVILGMGSSALRGMAFGKPLIVQGELGFWRLCSSRTVAEFLDAGWYGLGDLPFPVGEAGLSVGAARLRNELEPLLTIPDRRRELGVFGRKLVVERFSLARAAVVQEQVYADALASELTLRPRVAARSAFGMVAHHLQRKLQRWRGACPPEDFNSVAIIRRGDSARVLS